MRVSVAYKAYAVPASHCTCRKWALTRAHTLHTVAWNDWWSACSELRAGVDIDMDSLDAGHTRANHRAPHSGPASPLPFTDRER